MDNKRNNIEPPKQAGAGRGPGAPGGGFVGEKAKDFNGTLRKLLRYLSGFKLSLAFVIITAMLSTIFSIVGPKVLGSATNLLYDGFTSMITGGAGIDFAAIGRIIGLLAVLYIISFLFSSAQGFTMAKISTSLTKKLRSEMSEKIHSLPLSYYDKTSNGDILSRITNDIDVISQSFNTGITQIITSTTTIIGILVMMFSINFTMTLITLVTLPLSFIGIISIAKRSQKYHKRTQNNTGQVNSLVEENYSCHNIVKAFNGEEKSLEQFKECNQNLYDSAWKANFISGLMMPAITFLGNLGYVGVCIAGGYLAAAGQVNIGDIQAFVQYVRQFNQPLSQISQISNIIQQTIAAAERVFEFLEEDDEVLDAESALTVKVDGSNRKTDVVIEGNVSFNNVNFGYAKDKTIINDFTTSVKQGQKVAIVGPTGAGKTTMMKLLMRFYDVNSGEILVDGHNIKDFKRSEIRSVFGMVLQDTWLYNGSIADNIRYSKQDATKEDIIAAANAAQVDRFVRTLPESYDMVLNEETGNISQGQKQLLTIARAILADPKVLILDEATSSVDTRTEMLIQKAMDNLMVGRTSFIIAHRLSTIRNADLILVMNNGDIVEQGNHDELMLNGGLYSALYNSQFSEN